ncbi:MAG: AAA family ATPase [Chitinivibrionales bacterium]|nr:AAA family ATPase [Chitinivibrionales bacterium]
MDSHEMQIIARKKEIKFLTAKFESKESELIAVYGRRRVGKTYLIRNFFLSQKCIYFELTGQKKENGEIASTAHQLANFQYAWHKAFDESIEKPLSWEEAFYKLKIKVDSLRAASQDTIVLFFDEMPWLCSANSGFYENFDQAWNACFEPASGVKVVVCGSASTWILKKIIYAKAGLSRRVTGKIPLKPFTLNETSQYLAYKSFVVPPETVAELYMIFGGIPYYLNFLDRSTSIYQNIDRLCFRKTGDLYDEYNIIFDSLFKNSGDYKQIIELLAKRRIGYTFREIVDSLQKSRREISASTLREILRNLHECDFISRRVPLFNQAKGTVYSLCDEFVLFCIQWMLPRHGLNDVADAYWQSIMNSSSYRSWLGFSFELLCLKHSASIRHALGIHKISSIAGIFYAYSPKTGKRASQIDLLFDRSDKTITICEIKHASKAFEITRQELDALKQKKHDLLDYLEIKRKKRSILFAYITLHGIKRNACFNEIFPEVVTLEDMLNYS